MTATTNPFRAPTSHETSTLECTHVSCGSCDRVEPWTGTLDASAWRCPNCGDDPGVGPQPVWEHSSPTPLGYRDDKACHWQSFTVGGVHYPEEWIYKAARPGA